MKNLYFLMILSFCGTSSLNAQAIEGIGVRGGGNIASIMFLPNARGRGVESITGFEAGLIYKNISTNHLGVQLELNMSQRGWQEVTDTLNNIAYKLDYLELPFMSHGYVGNQKVRLFLNLGIFIGFRLSGEQKITENGETRTEPYDYQAERDNLFDYGLKAGAGISYNFNWGNIFGEARYTFGFGNVLKPEIPLLDASRSQIITISGGYIYEF
ncbi:MAG: porin family protein [Candidatus Cyclobacteriaceae bacterium M3_2C_046]